MSTEGGDGQVSLMPSAGIPYVPAMISGLLSNSRRNLFVFVEGSEPIV